MDDKQRDHRSSTMSRRSFLRRTAAGLGITVGLGLPSELANTALKRVNAPLVSHPHTSNKLGKYLPAGRLIIGGGRTGKVFSELETYLPEEKKTWKEYLKDKKIICVTCGAAFTTYSPEKKKAAIQKRMESDREFYTKKGVKEKDIIFINNREEAEKKEIVAILRNPKNKIVFDGGAGDQDAIEYALRNTPLEKELFKRLLGDPYFFGFTTSASAMVLVKNMRSTNDKGINEIHSGLGWFKDSIIDTHAHDTANSRIERGKDAVRIHPECTSVVIDGATAIDMKNNEAKIIGTGKVYIIKAKDVNSPEEALRAYKAGDKIDKNDLMAYLSIEAPRQLFAEAGKLYNPSLASAR